MKCEYIFGLYYKKRACEVESAGFSEKSDSLSKKERAKKARVSGDFLQETSPAVRESANVHIF